MISSELLSDGLFARVRLADLLDVAIVAVLLYVGFVWLRNRASRTLGLVAAALAFLFFIARWLDLYLTTMVFHYGLVGILLAMVVVFQHDIRHGFERLASWRWFHHCSPGDSSAQLIDAICEAVGEMARTRIGALIVFPGHEPLDRHIRGGVDVDSRISLPLLLSIFHPRSPGHDGAVLIESNRIASLGVHLPLTTQVEKVHDCGTRHAAALGLAECCDALVVVVSEERGTITVAQDAELTEVDPTDLADRLRHYFKTQDGLLDSEREYRLSDWMTWFAALTVAATLWFVFAYQTDNIHRTFVVPIEYRNLPTGFEIKAPKPQYAEVTLSGPDLAFAMLDPANIAVSLRFAESSDGHVFRWQTRSNLSNVPAELEIESIVPDTITVSLRPKSMEPTTNDQ